MYEIEITAWTWYACLVIYRLSTAHAFLGTHPFPTLFRYEPPRSENPVPIFISSNKCATRKRSPRNNPNTIDLASDCPRGGTTTTFEEAGEGLLASFPLLPKVLIPSFP